ncbi:hypothetical protein [Pandoraea sp. NPDC087047]|uniref:hypothetical protein n=1 Tax=Pandoraea sp. NPDC087047 TaxID=3364390 RepID=UPI00382B7183
MELRSIICPSMDGIAFLRAWLPPAVAHSSRFFCPSNLSDVPSTARDVIYVHQLQTLLIHNAHTTDPDLAGERDVCAEEVLSINASTEQFEIAVVTPTLFVMLFETPEIFKTIFGDRATEYLHLMGSYDPERAIREAGMTVADIIRHLNDATRERLRATPTAQRILERIAILDAKPFSNENGGDHAVHRRPPQLIRWD